MDLESEMVDLVLKIRKLEDKNKEIMWVLERQHEILRVLGADYRKRVDPNRDDLLEGMYS